MGIFNWLIDYVEDARRENEERYLLKFAHKQVQAKEAQRAAAEEQIKTIQARMVNAQTTLDEYNRAIDSLQNFPLTVESAFDEYAGYLKQYPSNQSLKKKFSKKSIDIYGLLPELPDDFDFDFVVSVADSSSIDEAQKKAAPDLVVAVDNSLPQ